MAKGVQGVGGLRTSEEVGEQAVTTGPGGAKATRTAVSFRRETWPTHRRRKACHRNF